MVPLTFNSESSGDASMEGSPDGRMNALYVSSILMFYYHRNIALNGVGEFVENSTVYGP